MKIRTSVKCLCLKCKLIKRNKHYIIKCPIKKHKQKQK
uniref:Ribosomal protein n=1 Tax=Nephromyces sp. ex Molgula occidentalis TaxID=2544991 RepID=A0A5C1H885_9APIC|nr:50S ribosomal protein L36 [Nephromyces sp. ex Molgula occidentalis]